MFDVGLPVAFASGLVSFFAPCVLPLLPAYVGYVTGVSAKELNKKGYAPYMKKILSSSFFYILGFSTVFVILGTVAAGLSGFLSRFDFLIQKLGGLLIIFLGLNFAGFVNIPFLARERKLKLPEWSKKIGYARSFIVGVTFATAWTPCVGVILGSILTLAAVSGTAGKGALLLFSYSMGLSLPFVIVSLTLASAPKYVSFIGRYIGTISKIAGILLAVLGILLLTGSYKYLNGWLFEMANNFGYQVR